MPEHGALWESYFQFTECRKGFRGSAGLLVGFSQPVKGQIIHPAVRVLLQNAIQSLDGFIRVPLEVRLVTLGEESRFVGLGGYEGERSEEQGSTSKSGNDREDGPIGRPVKHPAIPSLPHALAEASETRHCEFQVREKVAE